MQTQILPTLKSVDQRSLPTSTAPMQVDAKGGAAATPFADVIKLLANGSVPGLVEVAPIFVEQKLSQPLGQNVETSDEPKILARRLEGEVKNNHLSPEGNVRKHAHVEHHNFAATSLFPNNKPRIDTGGEMRDIAPHSVLSVSDNNHQPHVTGHNDELKFVERQSTPRRHQTSEPTPQIAAVLIPTEMATPKTPRGLSPNAASSKGQENSMSLVPTSSSKGQTFKQPDILDMRSPIELVLWSLQPIVKGEASITVSQFPMLATRSDGSKNTLVHHPDPRSIPEKVDATNSTVTPPSENLSTQHPSINFDAKVLPSKQVKIGDVRDLLQFSSERQNQSLPPQKVVALTNKPALIESKGLVVTSSEVKQRNPISEGDIRDQRPTVETPKANQYMMTTAPVASSAASKTLDSKMTIDGTKDTTDFRLETMIDTKHAARTTQSTVSSRTEFAPPVARQIADAIHARVTAEKVIEVSLNPAELGRLKLSLTPVENGLVINIMAERSETNEMIRRNLIDLERAFSEMGGENITFSFEQNGGFPDQGQHDPSIDSADWSEQVAATPTLSIQQHRDLTITSGIDIRV